MLVDRSILGVGRRSDPWVAGVLLGAGLLSKGPITLLIPAALVLLPRTAGVASAQPSDGQLEGPSTTQRATTRVAPTGPRGSESPPNLGGQSLSERVRRSRPLIALLVAVVVAAMWIVPLWLREGTQFVERLVVDQVKERALGRGNHRQGPLFYLVALPPMLLPWAPLSIGAAVAFAWPAVRRTLGPATLPLATLAGLLVLSAIPTKDPRYAIVLVPPLSIVAAQAASALCDRVRDETKAAGHLRALSFVAIALGAAFAGATVMWPSSAPWVVPPAVVAVAAGLGGIRRARRSDAAEAPSESGARALASRWVTLLVLLVACGGAVYWAAFARYLVHASVVENRDVAATLPEGVPTAILMHEGLEPDDLYEAVRRPISLHGVSETPSPSSAPRLVVVCLESDVESVAKARGEAPTTLLRRERHPEQHDEKPTVLVVLRFGA
jgi:4-amino-4-deoxy-L-arabinose transferase-like glycosyltransferase